MGNRQVAWEGVNWLMEVTFLITSPVTVKIGPQTTFWIVKNPEYFSDYTMLNFKFEIFQLKIPRHFVAFSQHSTYIF